MKRRKAVALLIETSNAYARGLLDGIIAWQREHEAWSIYLPEQERGAAPPAWLKSWQGDGIIVRIETEAIANAVRRTNLPVVDVSAARRVPDIPWVETHDEAIANLAAAHLLERGFRHLAFCGEQGFNWSQWRCEHFECRVKAAGATFHQYHSKSRFDHDFSWNRERQRLMNWLSQLPRPIGIMACYDIKGQQVLDACRELDIAVPEEMAVVGVDNDARICNLSTPPMSSIIPDSRRTGYEAARLLDAMMAGVNVPADAHLIPPLGIAERPSTDILAIDDADIVKAMRFIRQHAFDGINVGDVLKQVSLSRRALEDRFQRLIGRTPHQEIERLRMDRVKQLLVETSLPLQTIAQRTGFRHAEYLAVAFKRFTRQTPGQFRRHGGARGNKVGENEAARSTA
ncbi:MAG: XylR family transcriptional regulator [Planctomycetota bacterium]|nr:MAG: XylR family transcriptional regulator [Planctomycetota bacterium]